MPSPRVPGCSCDSGNPSLTAFQRGDSCAACALAITPLCQGGRGDFPSHALPLSSAPFTRAPECSLNLARSRYTCDFSVAFRPESSSITHAHVPPPSGEQCAAGRSELYRISATILGVVHADDQTFLLELIREPGHVAAAHHQSLRQLVHLQPAGIALELRHQIEARQRDAELCAQPPADFRFDEVRAGEQAQPQLEA